MLEHDTYLHVIPASKHRDPLPLAIAVNADSLATWFSPVSSELLKQRHIALEIILEDQDHTWPLLARGEVSGCISTAPAKGQGFTAVPLGVMEYRCVSNQSFADSFFPKGISLPQVISTPAILFNRKDLLHDIFLEAVFGFKVEKYAKHYFPSPLALYSSIRAGAGYGLVPTIQIESLLESGEIVDLAPTHPVLVKLYWHHWQSEPPTAKAITECIINAARTTLLQN